MVDSERTTQLLQDLTAAYSTKDKYIIGPHFHQIAFTNPNFFTYHHSNVVHRFLKSGGTGKDHQPRAFLSEWLALQSLRFLNTADYRVQLAPYSLESGSLDHKGTDIIVSQQNNDACVPLLGINVKLESIRNKRIHEKHRYDKLLCAPTINLSLGDWGVSTWEKKQLDVKSWLDTLVLSKLMTTGKVPYFDSFKSYVFESLFRTVGVYKEKLDKILDGTYPINFQERKIIPETREEFTILYDKINLLYTLFDECRNTNNF